MSDCCDPTPGAGLETLPAGLDTLPRQLRSFSDVRGGLLAAVPSKPALSEWKPSGDDLGLMWLEMWAYVADVLAFYDARVADASYLRTAPSRRALTRIVELLGHSPRGGIAGRATLAVLGKGKPGILPAGTGFRSAAFADQPPQVFETEAPVAFDPLKNVWTVKPFKRTPKADIDGAAGAPPSVGKSGGAATNLPMVSQLLFEPGGYGLAVDSLVLFSSRNPEFPDAVRPLVTRVQTSAPFSGKDGAAYVRATFARPVSIEPELSLNDLRVRTPVQSFVATNHTPQASGKSTTSPITQSGSATIVYLDGVPGRFRAHDAVIVAKNLQGPEPQLVSTEVASAEAAALEVSALPAASDGSRPLVVGTRLTLQPGFGSELGVDAGVLSFHHDFVDAGRATNVAQTTVSLTELRAPAGVPLGSGVKPPAEAEAAVQKLGVTNAAGILEQRFLISDAAGQAANVAGRITFNLDGSAHFQLLDPSGLPSAAWKLPLRIYGNLVESTRGESVPRETLGSGDAAQLNQRFKLKQKPLTYLTSSGSGGGNDTGESTLQVWVDGIRWREVPNLFGSGPEARVYYVRQNEEGESSVLFGDGVYGARLPSGVGNVVASYRYGAGFAAPPSDAITQPASAVEGLQGAASPLPAQPGKDPEGPLELREAAPRSALMLGRIVGIADFQAVAAAAPGVVRAVAAFVWLEEQMQAGIRVDYIGDANATFVLETLRSESDPTMPLAVIRARPLAAALSIAVEVDPRYQKAAVERAVYEHFTARNGVASASRAQIGGRFWPSALYAAAGEVDGVLGVAGLSCSISEPGIIFSATDGTCLPSNAYLDFTASGAVTVTGVDPKGGLAGLTGSGSGGAM